jgi:hypothetical protein
MRGRRTRPRRPRALGAEALACIQIADLPLTAATEVSRPKWSRRRAEAGEAVCTAPANLFTRGLLRSGQGCATNTALIGKGAARCRSPQDRSHHAAKTGSAKADEPAPGCPAHDGPGKRIKSLIVHGDPSSGTQGGRHAVDGGKKTARASPPSSFRDQDKALHSGCHPGFPTWDTALVAAVRQRSHAAAAATWCS